MPQLAGRRETAELDFGDQSVPRVEGVMDLVHVGDAKPRARRATRNKRALNEPGEP
jgi:hypothetical protein